MAKLWVGRALASRSSSSDATTLARSVPSGVVGARGLAYRLSGGLRPDRISGRRP